MLSPWRCQPPQFFDKGRIIYAIAAFQTINAKAEAERIQFTKELALKMLLCSRHALAGPTLEQKSRSALKNCHKLEILKATQAKLVFENALCGVQNPHPMIIKLG